VPFVEMADLEPATTAPTQTARSVDMTARRPEEVLIDKITFDESVPPMLASADSEGFCRDRLVPFVKMADLEPAITAPAQTEQSVDMTTPPLEEVPIDEMAFDESVPPVFGSADSEDEWDEDDFAHEDLIRAPMRRNTGELHDCTLR
jgi:hypothetical protein